jgi:hypothetical protein
LGGADRGVKPDGRLGDPLAGRVDLFGTTPHSVWA